MQVMIMTLPISDSLLITETLRLSRQVASNFVETSGEKALIQCSFQVMIVALQKPDDDGVQVEGVCIKLVVSILQ